MVQAYILIQTEVGRAAAVASDVSGIEGVTRAEDVTGPYDVIVLVESAESTEPVIAQVRKVPGITRTLTCPLVASSTSA